MESRDQATERGPETAPKRGPDPRDRGPRNAYHCDCDSALRDTPQMTVSVRRHTRPRQQLLVRATSSLRERYPGRNRFGTETEVAKSSNGWPLSCGRHQAYHGRPTPGNPDRHRVSITLTVSAVSFSGLLGGDRCSLQSARSGQSPRVLAGDLSLPQGPCAMRLPEGRRIAGNDQAGS